MGHPCARDTPMHRAGDTHVRVAPRDAVRETHRGIMVRVPWRHYARGTLAALL